MKYRTSKRQLRRAEEGKLVAGVIGGLARYFEHDPLLFRLAAVFLLLVTGVFPGLVFYAIGWLTMPKEEEFPYEVLTPQDYDR